MSSGRRSLVGRSDRMPCSRLSSARPAVAQSIYRFARWVLPTPGGPWRTTWWRRSSCSASSVRSSGTGPRCAGGWEALGLPVAAARNSSGVRLSQWLAPTPRAKSTPAPRQRAHCWSFLSQHRDQRRHGLTGRQRAFQADDGAAVLLGHEQAAFVGQAKDVRGALVVVGEVGLAGGGGRRGERILELGAIDHPGPEPTLMVGQDRASDPVQSTVGDVQSAPQQ